MKHAAHKKAKPRSFAQIGAFVFAICLAMCIALSTANASNGKGALAVAKDAVAYKTSAAAYKSSVANGQAEDNDAEMGDVANASDAANADGGSNANASSSKDRGDDATKANEATDAESLARANRNSDVRLAAPVYDQYAEGLPTGCESAALASALGHYGFDVTPVEIADTWLERSDGDFVNAFMGDPHTEGGGMVSAPGLQAAANRFLSAQGSALHASDLTDASLNEILDALDSGSPVVIWLTIGYDPAFGAYAWQDGYVAMTNSHTVVLVGHNADRSMLYFVDSIDGEVEMPTDEIAHIYEDCGSQALVIR